MIKSQSARQEVKVIIEIKEFFKKYVDPNQQLDDNQVWQDKEKYLVNLLYSTDQETRMQAAYLICQLCKQNIESQRKFIELGGQSYFDEIHIFCMPKDGVTQIVLEDMEKIMKKKIKKNEINLKLYWAYPDDIEFGSFIDPETHFIGFPISKMLIKEKILEKFKLNLPPIKQKKMHERSKSVQIKKFIKKIDQNITLSPIQSVNHHHKLSPINNQMSVSIPNLPDQKYENNLDENDQNEQNQKITSLTQFQDLLQDQKQTEIQNYDSILDLSNLHREKYIRQQSNKELIKKLTNQESNTSKEIKRLLQNKMDQSLMNLMVEQKKPIQNLEILKKSSSTLKNNFTKQYQDTLNDQQSQNKKIQETTSVMNNIFNYQLSATALSTAQFRNKQLNNKMKYKVTEFKNENPELEDVTCLKKHHKNISVQLGNDVTEIMTRKLIKNNKYEQEKYLNIFQNIQEDKKQVFGMKINDYKNVIKFSKIDKQNDLQQQLNYAINVISSIKQKQDSIEQFQLKKQKAKFDIEQANFKSQNNDIFQAKRQQYCKSKLKQIDENSNLNREKHSNFFSKTQKKVTLSKLHSFLKK